jgi:endonuclease/exonuclease/phosphatase (EEP) superfamily protein YafD
MDVPFSDKVLEQPKSNRSATASAGRRWAKIIVAILGSLYLIAVIGSIYVIRTWGDRTTTATLLLFAPRWLFALPLVLLIPLAAWVDWRLLILPGVAAALVLFGLLGFSLGWRRLLASPAPTGSAIRVLTFNTHFSTMWSPWLAAYIQTTHPDVVALEEWGGGPYSAVFKDATWHFAQRGDNVLASRFPIQPRSLHRGEDFFHCNLLLPSGPVDVVVLHLSSPHTALRDTVEQFPDASPEIERNISWRARQAAAIGQLAEKQTLPMLLMGDFNLVPDSTVFRQNFSNLSDAFESAGFGFGYSYIIRWTRVRIDHVLMNDSFRCQDCFVGPYLGSPHRPIVADLIPLRR